jgi:hypothetical protein
MQFVARRDLEIFADLTGFFFVEGNIRGAEIYCFEVVHVGCLVAVQVPVVHIDSMELSVLRGDLVN